MRNTQSMLATFKIKLHKVSSNSTIVLAAIPEQDRDSSLKDIDPEQDLLPDQRALGIKWDPNRDCFTYQVSGTYGDQSRRAMVSYLNSQFDPLGGVVPVSLAGKLILRELGSVDWDSEVPEHIKAKWKKWASSLSGLQDITLPRCYHPAEFEDITRREIHAFSDASTDAVGQVMYLRSVTADNKVHVAFISAKSKLVNPKTVSTLPRAELEAAEMAVNAVQRFTKEVDMKFDDIQFYTDSKVVLGWLSNHDKRFHTFVSNRVNRITNSTDPATQWNWISGTDNPADMATRPVSVKDLNSTIWFNGPDMLWAKTLDKKEEQFVIADDDKEVKKNVTVLKTESRKPPTKPLGPLGLDRFQRFSTWKGAVRALTTIRNRIRRCKKDTPPPSSLDMNKESEKVILRALQAEMYASEIATLRQSEPLPKKSPLYALDPFLCESDGLLRVGGRLRRNEELSFEEKHPIILPGKHYITSLIVEHIHQKSSHLGRSTTLYALRKNGYWPTSGRHLVGKVINACVTCRRLRGPTLTQKTADLPTDRTSTDPPFTNVGVDVFGPWDVYITKTPQGTNTRRTSFRAKRWALIIVCQNTRAIHIETLESMDTSAFINAMRRFVCLRGPCNIIRSDQGTNIMGAKSQLDTCDTIDLKKVEEAATDMNCRWLPNPPHASNFSGAWERMIGMVRSILDHTLMAHRDQLTHDTLSTFFAEAVNIVNSRPLGIVSSDGTDLIPISPNHLITMKGPALPPPGEFTSEDKYAKKRWRAVQMLADSFFKKLRQSYLPSLQTKPNANASRNTHVGDVVIVKDLMVRRPLWPMGIVEKVVQDEDGLVRRAFVKMAGAAKGKTLERAVNNLVLLFCAED